MQKTKVVGVRFPYQVYQKLEAIRQQERRTKSNMVVVLVEEALKARNAQCAQSSQQARRN